ncbi:hypothetical protein [Streptomyces sp. NRRL B-24484]|uniref:hypothetical protein n=1 Tax=Streptomyces sp. NRRL B-24484 TaxID=1463833 RepID=UPI0004C0FC99|nr:hypothetical protein [Streptomyces sp. NRRL B-24484]
MPCTRKEEAPLLVDSPVVRGRYAELDDCTVSFETFPEDADGTPAFPGLPDDRCQGPHWGMVISGLLQLRYRDRTECYAAGDVYHAPPGHLPVVAAGTGTIDFGPSDELRETTAVVAADMSRAGGAR